ncbi:MAG: signal peptidase I [Actinomycetota bacterium]
MLRPKQPPRGDTSDDAESSSEPPLTAKTEEAESPAEPTAGSPAAEGGAAKSKKRSRARHLAELPILVLLALVIAVIIKTFLVQAFYIPSGSMFPTLHVGDRVLVEKLSYRFGGPGRGDVVVFERDVFGAGEPDVPWHQDMRNFVRDLLGLPTGQSQDYIKRVVAVEGDTIRYAGTPRELIVNGEAVDQSYIHRGRDRSSPTVTSDDCKRLEMEKSEDGCLVPEDMVFVMGDNRGNSEDSRVLGPVGEDKIVGKAFLIIWPPSDVGTI